MIIKEYEHGYGDTWKDTYISRKEAYSSSVSDFHEHEFYEINLILSGNVNILLKDHMVQGTHPFLVLTRPGTPHYISCKPDTLYSRLYFLFSHTFISGVVANWEQALSVFGKNGTIISLTEQQAKQFQSLIEEIQAEPNRFRKQLLTFYLLSLMGETTPNNRSSQDKLPGYIMAALEYIDNHFDQKIVAEELAKQFYVSRTTLMTGFKKYIGVTLNEYILDCRLKHAIYHLTQGISEQETALICGFSDSSSLIRAFKKMYQVTPRKYMNSFTKIS
jgi:AraC-like DNA-binding protein